MLAALWQSSLVRIVPVGIVLLALQRSVFVEITVAGVIIPIVMAFAAATGAAGGSERGATAGFVLGLMYDMVEGAPLGSTTIAMTLAGAVAGTLALVVAEPRWYLAMVFSGLGAAVGELMIPVVRLFTGIENPFETRLYTIVPIVAVASALLSPILVPLGRWCLRIEKSEWVAPKEAAA